MATLFTLFALIISAMFAWGAYGLADTLMAAGYLPWLSPGLAWLAPAGVFFLMFVVLNAVLVGLLSVLALSGGGLWSASPLRWVIGKVALFFLGIPAVLLALWALSFIHLTPSVILWMLAHPIQMFMPFGETPPPGATDFESVKIQVISPMLRLMLISLLCSFIAACVRREKPIVAYATMPFRALWSALKTGVGGSAAFDGLMDEWLMPWKSGQVLLGTSLYEPGRKLGSRDDRHMLTIASTRSGKGRSSIIPNLLLWPGSALVIDPKGQNAAVTAMARKRMGQDIHIVDPFGELPKLGLDPRLYPTKRFNPLDALRIEEIDIVEQIGSLADALIVRSDHGNPFWDNAAKAVLVGIIAHVLTWPELASSDRHLGTVRDYVSGERDMKDMERHAGVANLATIGYLEFMRASAGAGGDIMTTLAVHVKWLDSLAMEAALATSDFDLGTLKTKGATLYLILPARHLEEHNRFLRMFITLAIRAAGQGIKPKHPMLFVLDEFFQLGYMKIIEQAAGLLAGSGVKLWPIVQNLTQLRPYGDNWETFIANAGQIQVFAINDQSTARYFSERLGQHIAWRRVGSEWIPQGPTFFRTAPELSRESNRDSGKALVFFEGGRQALVRRAPYDKIFKPEDYTRDPSEPGGGPANWADLWGKFIDHVSDAENLKEAGQRIRMWTNPAFVNGMLHDDPSVLPAVGIPGNPVLVAFWKRKNPGYPYPGDPPPGYEFDFDAPDRAPGENRTRSIRTAAESASEPETDDVPPHSGKLPWESEPPGKSAEIVNKWMAEWDKDLTDKAHKDKARAKSKSAGPFPDFDALNEQWRKENGLEAAVQPAPDTKTTDAEFLTPENARNNAAAAMAEWDALLAAAQAEAGAEDRDQIPLGKA